MSVNMDHLGQSYTYHRTNSSWFTYESASEDLVVSGAQLSPQIVCGDSTCSSCFLSVVHLLIKLDIYSLNFMY